jgi:acyl transferase domain-containing protein
MSYFLNTHGPSEPVETACSSSLVAIHRAISAMEDGSCNMAIVGGVNTILTPEMHISFNKAGMLSEDGRCKTFSENANGYVRGEGVGMLFLKKRKKAEEDGDHIYGLIRGTAENHGGRVNSLTAPNPKAQAELLVRAYKNAGIDPRSVSYIEAHGTGTSLGDPIEINGLKMAFEELYGENEKKSVHCGLGSVKSNIGHLEFAAGVAGVIKVLLQLKHKEIVKSLHCETVNPYIHLEDSPFYIVQKKRKWKVLKDQNGKKLPRRAGVSSFGFGGVNAHIILEEYPSMTQEKKNKGTKKKPQMIVLSARDDERLKGRARSLLEAIEREGYIEDHLEEIAYTLQVGREEMEERLGFTATSMEELKAKLLSFLDDDEGIENMFRGNSKSKDTAALFLLDEDFEKIVKKWFDKNKYSKLLELWTKGFTLNWYELYQDYKPKRINLPSYIFAKNNFSIDTKDAYSNLIIPNKYLHPLIHENTTSLKEEI